MQRNVRYMFIALVMLVALTACPQDPPPPSKSAPTPRPTRTSTSPATETSTAEPATRTPEATGSTPVASATKAPDESATDMPSEASQPPAPQQIEFAASDGNLLAGTYYPAASPAAPVVVLMHWAPGNRSDWVDYALWLQNRADGETPAIELPALPEGFSAHVFTFDFRGHGESSGERTGPGRVLDAIAAIETAIALSGNPAAEVVTIGASIGADGAVDSCVEFEQCLGALSLSPGSYLDVSYAEAVERMGESGRTTICLAAANDLRSATACEQVGGAYHTTIVYPGDNAHGMTLFEREFDPLVIDVVAEFVLSLLGEG